MTTLEHGHEQWVQHIDAVNLNNNPTPNEVETTR